MAFDCTTQLVVLNPTFNFIVNDWNANTTVNVPTISASLNSYTCVSILAIPVVVATLDNPGYYAVQSSIPLPVVSGVVASSTIFNGQATLKMPSVIFEVDSPQIYNLNYTLPKVGLGFSIGIGNQYSLVKTLKIPQIHISTHFSSNNIRQTWTFNTITTAHSRYTNYNFNSYFKIGTKYFGVHTNGSIYELTGDRDFVGDVGETNILAEIDLPTSSFDEQQMKVCSDAIVYGRCAGDVEIQVVLDEQEARTGYIVSFDDRIGMHRKRVKIPKGLLGDVWQFKIKNVNGSKFDLNAFEVFLRTVQRIKR